MSSATPYGFSSAAELLEQSASIPRYLSGSLSESPGEGRSISVGDFSTQSTVTSLKTEGWTNSTTDFTSFDTRRRPGQTRQHDTSNSNIDRLALLASVASESVLGATSSTPSSFATTDMSTYISSSNAQAEAYISSSNAQAEALQTLHLMNPNYSGYGDLSNPGNLVLFSPATGAVSGQGSPLGSSVDQQHQQHLGRYTLPPPVTQASYPHPSHVAAAMSNTEMAHDSTASHFYTKRESNQGYNWGGGSEFSFLPSGHVTGENNQQLSAHINMMKPELSASHISHYGVGAMNASPYHEQASLFGHGLPGHGTDVDSLQVPSGAGHILSLSLSPQQPSMVQQLQSFSVQHNEPAAANFFHGLCNPAADGANKAGLFSNKCAGGNLGSSYTVQSCDNNMGMGYQTQLNPIEDRHVDILTSHLAVGSYGSKFLKPAQELLNELVSVGQSLKGNNTMKWSKPQVWTGPISSNDGSFLKTMDAMDAASKAVISWSGGKDQGTVVTTVPANIGAISEHTMHTPVEVSSADRQELQAKRAKLLGMRDEVDRRYKQYYHQMDMVARSFESSAGVGSAAAYTALALETISKHFRCLRDAINCQIQVTCKALGEEEACGTTRGGTSKLRFIDQQLRQQRALRQLGMMQQQAWRPQRGLPEHSVSILRAWLFEHFLHPYPKDSDKIMLAKQTGLNRNQVSNWFINARVRLWKPMIEEMYLEETKEAEAERADKSGSHEGHEEELAGTGDGTLNSEFNQPFKQAKLSEENHQGFGDVKGSSSYNSSDVLQGRILAGSPSENLLLHEKEGMRQGVMKLANAHQDVAALLSGSGLEYKANKANGEGVLERENRIRADDGFKDSFNVEQNGFVQTNHLNLAGCGSYQMNGLNRYGQESFGASYTANTGVSLTLGLQHCDGLSFSGGQQHYGQASTAHLLTSRRENDGISHTDYYNVNESNYEGLGLQSRKPFPSHMLCRDFVV